MSRQQVLGSHTPTTKLQQMALALFKELLSSQKIQSYISLQPDHLKLICKQAGTLFHRKLGRKPNQVLAFLNSYHQIIMGYTQKVVNKIINDISLHFLLLSSYTMIESGDRFSAKQFLKKALKYIDSTDPDAILLTTALNNLCILRMQEGKYYKSVSVLLHMIQIMQGHLQSLKRQKKKSQIMEDSVFLINSYYLLAKCLCHIKVKNSQDFYKQLLHYSLQEGIRKAIKYLGRESFLTKKLIQIKQGQQSFQLPIFKIQQVERSTYQDKLMKQLQKIQQLLNTPRDIIIKQVVKQAPPPPPKQQKNLICQCSRMINNWNVQIQLLKQKNQKLGTVVFNCRKGNDYINLIIGQERLLKLLSQMNITDVLPEQCNLGNLAPPQFIQYCIFNFLYISDNKNIQIFPRATNYLTTFLLTLFGKQHIIFLYHIRGENFRISLGSKTQPYSFNLQIQFQQKFIQSTMQIQQQVQKRIYAQYKNLMQLMKKQNNMKNVQLKVVTVKNQDKLIRVVEGIMKRFEVFVRGYKNDQEINELFKQQLQFYKFVQYKPNQDKDKDRDRQDQKPNQKQAEQMQYEGKFYFIRYFSNIQGFEVNVQNTYETHNPSGKSKAKGQMLYNSYQFFRDFGMTSKLAVTRFRSFCQTLSKKYEIKYYQSPLTTNDKQIYQQNSMNQVKITLKSYSRKMFLHPKKRIIVPITASLVTVNNEIPAGIKIMAFDPVTCWQVGYFIHISYSNWKWPQKPQRLPEDIISNVVEQYGYKREYFLVDWLEKIGFRKIMELVNIDENDNFYLKGINCSFIRLGNVIDLFS